MSEVRRYSKKKISLQRIHTVSVRLNESELEQLDFRRGAYKRGEYLRKVFFENEPHIIPEINRLAWVELSRSASNLNQLAKHLNLVGASVSDVKQIQSLLAYFRASLLGVSLLSGEVNVTEEVEEEWE